MRFWLKKVILGLSFGCPKVSFWRQYPIFGANILRMSRRSESWRQKSTENIFSCVKWRENHDSELIIRFSGLRQAENGQKPLNIYFWTLFRIYKDRADILTRKKIRDRLNTPLSLRSRSQNKNPLSTDALVEPQVEEQLSFEQLFLYSIQVYNPRWRQAHISIAAFGAQNFS